MKKIILILFFTTFHIFAASNKKYEIPKVEIIAHINSDGSIDITENRTYKFKGKFKFAFQKLTKSDNIKYNYFSVSEGNIEYDLSDDKNPNTYKIIENSKNIEIKWYFRAKNESKVFSLNYKIENIIDRNLDGAILYHKFIGKNWKKQQSNITLKIIPPSEIPKNNIYAWLHGPLWADYEILNNGTIQAKCKNLPKKTFFEIRAIYPENLFNQLPISQNYIKNQIIDEEAQWAIKANIKRENAIIKEEKRIKRWSIGKWIVSFFSIIALLLGVYLYQLYGKRPILSKKIRMSSEIPRSIPPAILQFLFANKKIYGNAVISTIFDLAKKKIINIKENQTEEKTFFGNIKLKMEYVWEIDRNIWYENKSKLLEYENMLLEFIFNDLSNNTDTITLSEINKKNSAFIKFFKKWKTKVKKEAIKNNWFDSKSQKGMQYSLILTGFTAIISILFLIFFGPWAIISGICTVLLLILSFTIPHRNIDGEILYQKWNGLKNYFNKGMFKKDDEWAKDKIGDYLIYSIILGIKNKKITEMINLVPEEKFNDLIYWYTFDNHNRNSISNSMSFSNSFNTMIETTNSSMSTSDGSGGGASGGGGGGSGGGGGGAG